MTHQHRWTQDWPLAARVAAHGLGIPLTQQGPCFEHGACVVRPVTCDCGGAGLEFLPSGEHVWAEPARPDFACRTYDEAPTHGATAQAWIRNHEERHHRRRMARS